MGDYHVAVIGPGAVGKSALITRFVCHYFQTEYNPTIEDWFRTSCLVDCKRVALNIIDTADQEPDQTLHPRNVRRANGFLLVYSITEVGSLEQIEMLHRDLVRIKDDDNVPVVICGNKCDLEDLRSISKWQGEELARRLNVNFFETSAESDIHVDDAFIALIREMQKDSSNR